DIKGHNILFHSPLGSGLVFVKIADLGLVKIQQNALMSTKMTVAGTFPYMSPEVMLQNSKDVKADAKVDVWAAGILFYQLFTQEFPFDSSTPQSIMMFMMNKKLKRPSSVKDKVAWDLISKMLNFDRNKRLSAEKALNHEFFTGKKSNEGVTAEAVRLAQIVQTAKQNGNEKITAMETDAKFIIPVSDIKPILNVDPEAENEQLKKQINTRGLKSKTN
ncbi:MAG: hypothetical protein EZS28_048445, partial [Streblomastix strix]